MVEAKVSAGGLRPRLVAVWVLLLVLVAAIIAIEITDRGGTRGRESNAETGRDPKLLLPIPLAQVGAIEVLNAGVLHRFERDAAGAWFYHGVHQGNQAAHAHQTDPVLAKRIESALTGFDRARIERQLPLREADKEYGLTAPQMLILVYRLNESQPFAQYAVGDVAPDTFSRYVMVVGQSNVVTIANYQIDNLLALIKDASSAPNAAQPARKPS